MGNDSRNNNVNKFLNEFGITAPPAKASTPANTDKSNLNTLIFGGAGIIILSAVVFISTIMLSGNTAPSKNKSDFFAGEPAAIARGYKVNLLKSSAIFGAASGITVQLKVNRTETGLDAIDSELHERCLKPKLPNVANDVMRLGYISTKPVHTAAFVNCTMGIFKSRFCESYYRKRIAKRLSSTVKIYNKNKAMIKRLLGEKSAGGYTARMTLRVKNINNQGSNNGIRTGRNKGPIISKALGQKITELSKHGLLSKADFGSWVSSDIPEEIQPYMVEQSVDVCPSSWL